MEPLLRPPPPHRGSLARMAIAATVVCVLARPSMLVRATTLSTCATVLTCAANGGPTACDPRLEKCPPCVYPNADKFNCYDYDKEARTVQCPFLSVNTNYIDCSTATNWARWSTPATANSANATATGSNFAASKTANATASTNSTGSAGNTTVSSTAGGGSSSSKLVLYGGIGVGALVLLLVVLALCKRRKRKQPMRNTVPRHMARGSSKHVRTKHEEAFGGGGGMAYNHVETSKGGAYGSYQRKLSDPVMLEDASRDSDTTYMSAVPTDEALSVDGMLGEAPLTPVVLGGNDHGHGHAHYQQQQQPMQHHQTGKSVGQSSSAFTSVNDLVSQDISIRCTTSANVFDEYLRMKQEMNYDHDDDGMSEVMSEMSDLDSDTMSLSKFSLESSHGIGALARHDGGLSITDSEYDEHLRNRGASECFSEMSYNDEKYSFSEDDDMTSEFARSKPSSSGSGGHGVPDREVEI